MPVRKIPKSYVSVTGTFSSDKNNRSMGYESLLERDYMILLEYDDTVDRFEEQPVHVPFKKGVKPYTPDMLVHFKPQSDNSQNTKTLLAEVKTTDDLKINKDKYAQKFEAAKIYAEERGWEFVTMTEKKIRTPKLETLKFFREYHRVDPDNHIISDVMSAVKQLGQVQMGTLLDEICSDDLQKLMTIPMVWYLVAKQNLKIDFNKPVSNATKLSINASRPI